MHITCLRKNLHTALQKMANIVDVSKVPTKYSMILISAIGEHIQIFGTNTTAHLQLTVEGNTLSQGECCISLAHLLRVVASLVSTTIDLEVQKSKLVVNGDNGTCISLEAMKAEYFDKGIARLVDTTAFESKFGVDCALLSKAINKCTPFCDINTLTVISGIHFEDDQCGLRVMGCSNIAFASSCIKNILEENVHFNFTLTCKDTRCIVEVFDNIIDIAVGEGVICVQNDNSVLYLSVMLDHYPPMMSLIPKTTAQQLPIDCRKFKEVFDLTDIVSENTLVSVTYQSKQCVISCGDLVSTVISLEDEALSARFRLDYTLLRKVFKAEPQSEYILQYNTATTPAVIQTDDAIFMLSLAVAGVK